MDLIKNYMTVGDLVDLINHIQHKYSFGDGIGGKRRIKYVVPSYDTRTGRIFAIRLDNNLFSITNENRGEHLLTWVVAWLNREECAEPTIVEW